MTMKARIKGVGVLQFPDGTPTEVITRAAKRAVAEATAGKEVDRSVGTYIREQREEGIEEMGVAPALTSEMVRKTPIGTAGGLAGAGAAIALGATPAGALTFTALTLGAAAAMDLKNRFQYFSGSEAAPKTNLEAWQRMSDAATEEGLGELAGLGLGKLAIGGFKIMKPKLASGAKAASDFFSRKIKPVTLLPAEVSDSPTIRLVQNLAEGSFLGSGIINKFKTNRQQFMNDFADGLIDEFGTRTDPSDLGNLFLDVIDRKREFHGATSRVLYNSSKELVEREGGKRLPTIYDTAVRKRVYHGRIGHLRGTSRHGDLGVHFSENLDVASDLSRGEHLTYEFGARKVGPIPTGVVHGANIEPNKYLEMPDIGSWEHGAAERYMNEEMGLDIDTVPGADIFEKLKKMGYDGIRYQNEWEGGGWSYIMDPRKALRESVPRVSGQGMTPELFEQGAPVLVPTKRMKEFTGPIKEIAEELDSLEARNAGDDLVDTINGYGDSLTLEAAIELRTRLRSRIDEFNILNKNAPVIGKAKKLIGILDENIESSLRKMEGVPRTGPDPETALLDNLQATTPTGRAYEIAARSTDKAADIRILERRMADADPSEGQMYQEAIDTLEGAPQHAEGLAKARELMGKVARNVGSFEDQGFTPAVKFKGKVYTGAKHLDTYDKIPRPKGMSDDEFYKLAAEGSGFIDDKGKFVGASRRVIDPKTGVVSMVMDTPTTYKKLTLKDVRRITGGDDYDQEILDMMEDLEEVPDMIEANLKTLGEEYGEDLIQEIWDFRRVAPKPKAGKALMTPAVRTKGGEIYTGRNHGEAYHNIPTEKGMVWDPDTRMIEVDGKISPTPAIKWEGKTYTGSTHQDAFNKAGLLDRETPPPGDIGYWDGKTWKTQDELLDEDIDYIIKLQSFDPNAGHASTIGPPSKGEAGSGWWDGKTWVTDEASRDPKGPWYKKTQEPATERIWDSDSKMYTEGEAPKGPDGKPEPFRSVGDRAADSWRAANDYYRTGSKQFNNTMIRRLVKKARDEGTGASTIAPAIFKPGNLDVVKKVKAAVDAKTWDSMKGFFMEHLLAKSTDTGGDVMGQKIINNISGKPNSFGDPMLHEIFSAEQVSDIKQMAEALEIMQRKAVGSEGKMLIQLTQGGMIGALAMGKFNAAAGTVLIAPGVVAKIMTKPWGVRMITRGLQLPPNSPAAAGFMTRLLGAAARIRKEEYEDED